MVAATSLFRFIRRATSNVQRIRGQNRSLLVALASLCGAPVYAGTGYHNPIYRINFGDSVRGAKRPCDLRRGSAVNWGPLQRRPNIVRWHLGLTLLALLPLGSSFVFRLRGGAHNDAAPVLVICSLLW